MGGRRASGSATVGKLTFTLALIIFIFCKEAAGWAIPGLILSTTFPPPQQDPPPPAVVRLTTQRLVDPIHYMNYCGPTPGKRKRA